MRLYFKFNQFLKSLVVILIVFQFQFCYAQKDSLKNSYWFELSTFNDNWGGGYTPVYDNLRSYGLKLNARLNDNYFLKIQYSGLTHKNINGTQNIGRKDELIISADVALKKNAFNFVSIYGKFGAFLVGKYGGDVFQKTVHNYFSVKSDTLLYKDGNKLFGQIGFKLVSNLIILKKFESAVLCIKPEVETFFAPNYYYSFKPEIPFNIISPKGEFLSLAFGFQHSFSLTTDFVADHVIRSESGPFIDYKIRMGLFSLGLTTFINTNFSTGSYGINLLLNQSKSKFENSDGSIEFGGLTDGNGFYNKFLWNKTGLLSNHLMFVFYNQFGSYKKKRLTDYPYSYGNYQQLGIGGEVCAFKNNLKFQVNPYVGFNGGMKREMIYSGSQVRESDELVVPQITGEIGCKIKLPNSMFYKNTLWGVVFNYKNSLFLSGRTIDFEEKNGIKSSSDFFGVGLFVLTDL